MESHFYYVIRLRVEDELFNPIVLCKKEVNIVNGNDTFSPHSPKVLNMERRIN